MVLKYWLSFYNSDGILGLFFGGPLKIIGNLLQVAVFPISFMFQEPCVLYPPSNEQIREADEKGIGEDETWIYINGMATTKDIANANRYLLYQMFGRPVHLLHNPTDNVFFDLLECLSGKVGLFEFHEVKPRRELREILSRKLKEHYKKHKEGKPQKIILIAHSQGTIITGNVLRELPNESQEIKEAMKEMLCVFNFATCGHFMPAENVKYLE